MTQGQLGLEPEAATSPTFRRSSSESSGGEAATLTHPPTSVWESEAEEEPALKKEEVKEEDKCGQELAPERPSSSGRRPATTVVSSRASNFPEDSLEWESRGSTVGFGGRLTSRSPLPTRTSRGSRDTVTTDEPEQRWSYWGNRRGYRSGGYHSSGWNRRW